MAEELPPAPGAPAPAMGKTAAGGAAWLGLAQIVRVGLTMVSTVVIARLLSPDDYGVIAMVGPILALITMFQDLGLGTATIQAPTVTQRQSNALFWMNMTASSGLAALLILLSPAVAWFYGDARAGYVAAAGGASLLVSAVSLQHAALLNREMRFARIGMIDIAGLVATYTVAIILAFALRNYWALFLGTLAGSATQSLLYWQSSRFRPSRPSLSGAGDMARFGGHVTGFSLLNFLVRNLDDVLVARFSGAAAAGLYDRSYRLMMMPLQNINGPLNRLLQPILSRLRDEPVRYRRTFVMAMRGTMLAAAPGVAVATALSERFMPWLLGDKWAGAGPIFFWLGLTGLLQPIGNLTGVLFISTGRGREMMHWGFVSAVVTLIAFAIGVTHGPVGIAMALFFSQAVRMPLLYRWATAKTPVRQFDLYAAQIEPLIGAGFVAILARELGAGIPFVPLFAAAVALAYPAAFLTSCLTRVGRRQTIDLWLYVTSHVIQLIRPRRLSATSRTS